MVITHEIIRKLKINHCFPLSYGMIFLFSQGEELSISYVLWQTHRKMSPGSNKWNLFRRHSVLKDGVPFRVRLSLPLENIPQKVCWLFGNLEKSCKHTLLSRVKIQISLNHQCVSEKFIPGFNRFFPPATSELPYTSAMAHGGGRTMPDGDMRSTVSTRMSPSRVLSDPEKSKPNIWIK